MGLWINLEKIKVIREWEAPKTKKKVYTFLRFANYYKVFINKFATTATLFTVLTGKYPFLWTSEAQKAFEILKKSFISALILAQFDLKKETRLKADLFSYVVGDALL